MLKKPSHTIMRDLGMSNFALTRTLKTKVSQSSTTRLMNLKAAGDLM